MRTAAGPAKILNHSSVGTAVGFSDTFGGFLDVLAIARG
jgi:hypothetical protein